jgi:hypothetical protein
VEDQVVELDEDNLGFRGICKKEEEHEHKHDTDGVWA